MSFDVKRFFRPEKVIHAWKQFFDVKTLKTNVKIFLGWSEAKAFFMRNCAFLPWKRDFWFRFHITGTMLQKQDHHTIPANVYWYCSEVRRTILVRVMLVVPLLNSSISILVLRCLDLVLCCLEQKRKWIHLLYFVTSFSRLFWYCLVCRKR